MCRLCAERILRDDNAVAWSFPSLSETGLRRKAVGCVDETIDFVLCCSEQRICGLFCRALSQSGPARLPLPFIQSGSPANPMLAAAMTFIGGGQYGN
jgi:hypothetical protein